MHEAWRQGVERASIRGVDPCRLDSLNPLELTMARVGYRTEPVTILYFGGELPLGRIPLGLPQEAGFQPWKFHKRVGSLDGPVVAR